MADPMDPQALLQQINRLARLFQEGIVALDNRMDEDGGVDPGPPINEPKKKDPGVNQRRVGE